MTKAFASTVLAAILLLMAASTMALGFGAHTNFTALGQPLNYTVVLRLEPGEVVTQECVVADVQVGDAPVPSGKVRALLTAGAAPNERLVRISTTSLVDEPVIGVGVTVNCPTRIARKFVAFVDPPKKMAAGPTMAAAATLPRPEPVAMSPVSEVLQSAMSLSGGARGSMPSAASGDMVDPAASGSVDTRRRLARGGPGNAGSAAVAGGASTTSAVAAAPVAVMAAAPPPSEASAVRTAASPHVLHPSLLPYVGSARNDRVSPDDVDAVAAPPPTVSTPWETLAQKRAGKSDRPRSEVAAAGANRTSDRSTRRRQVAASRADGRDARGPTSTASVRSTERPSTRVASGPSTTVARAGSGSAGDGTPTVTADKAGKPSKPGSAVASSTATNDKAVTALDAAGAASLAASAATDARLAGEAVRALAAEMAGARTETAARLQALEEALKHANQQNAQAQASLASLRNQVAQNEADSPSSLTTALLAILAASLALGLTVVLMRRRPTGRHVEEVRESTIMPADGGPVAVEAGDEIEVPVKTPWWKFGRGSHRIASTLALSPAVTTGPRIEPDVDAADKPVKPDADQPPAATMREALSRAEMERKTTVPDTSAMAIAMRRPPSFDDDSSARRGSAARREMSVEEMMDLEQQAEFFLVLGQDDAAVDLLAGHLRDGGGASAMPYLKLMDIHRRLRDEAAYENVRDEFNQRFNANAPAWDADPEDGKELESYGDVVTRLQSLWGTPERALEVLEASLLRSHRLQADGEQEGKGESAVPFDLPAYRDVLLLYTVARDLAEQSIKAAAAGAAGVATPAGRWVGRVESVDLLLPIGEADNQEVDFGRVTAPGPLLSTMPVETHPGVERELSLDVDISSFGPLVEVPALTATPAVDAHEPMDLPRDFDYPDTIDPNDGKSYGSRPQLMDADDVAALDFQLEFSLPGDAAPEPQAKKESPKNELKWVGGDPDGF